MENYKIYKYIDDISELYTEPVMRIDKKGASPALKRDPREIIRTIEFYSDSLYLSGNRDELNREKPFYNVSNYRVTVSKVGTDIDIKDIRYEAESLKDDIAVMLINHELFKYLKEINFAMTLNDMGYTRPKYGGVLIKKCEYDGKLMIEVCDWTKVDFNPSNILGSPIVENHFMQADEVSERADVWSNVEEFMAAHAKAHKGKPMPMEIKEINGVFPMTFAPDQKDTEKNSAAYKRMSFTVGLVNKKKFLLHFEFLKENPYKYLPWEKRGLGLGRGVVEDGFEAQIWINDAMISMKNVMQLAGKVILATTSKKVSGNAITSMDNGHIIEMEKDATLTSLNLMPSALPQFENMINLWNQQYDRVASTFDANTGEAPTAGTPYSQTALLNQVANSPLEYRREEWGVFLNDVLNDWILPHVKKRIKKAHYLVSEFSEEELKLIDEAILAKNGKKFAFDKMLSGVGEIPTPDDMMSLSSAVSKELNRHGGRREIKIPEGFLDVEGRITANITGELKNKAAMLQSLDSIFKTVVSTYNPNTGEYGALQDPTLSKIFGAIVAMSGVPITMSTLKKTDPAMPQMGMPAEAMQPDLSAIAPQAPQGVPAY